MDAERNLSPSHICDAGLVGERGGSHICNAGGERVKNKDRVLVEY